MRKIILKVCIILGSFFYTLSSFAQNTPPDAYNIKVQIKPLHNQKVYLGHYFRGSVPLVDSVMLNENSEATFKGRVKLHEGIYAIFYPDKTFMCDVMIDTLQHFSVNAEKTSTGNLILQFKNSPGNTLLDQYEHYIAVRGAARQAAQQKLKGANGKMDSILWQHKISAIDDSIQNYREAVIKKVPGSILSRLFITMREVKLPAPLKEPKNAADSAAAKQFISDHYWDGVNFWDGGLTYSPFFEEKIDRYFNEVLPKNDDTVMKKISWMMGYAAADEIMNEFLLKRLLYGMINHSYKLGDEVFVFLFEKYVAPKTYTWLSADAVRVITERAYVLMGKTVRAPAPDIDLPSLDGKNTSLYSVNSNYTILCFWDPLCSHCRLILPMMDSMYNKKWKARGVKIFSIGCETEGTIDDWVNYVNEHKLQDWVNVYYSLAENRRRYDAGLKEFATLFEILHFPAFFLLDKDKNFIAKRLNYEQMVDLLDLILKPKG